MQVATLAIAVLGVALSALSLGWQAATFVLTGDRVELELRMGAAHATGAHMVTMPVRSATQESVEQLRAEGYTRPVVAIQVRNVGRLPVSVMSWSLVASPGGTAFIPVGQSIGPPLPHRLEAGAEQLWAVEATAASALAHATAEVLKVSPHRVKVRGRLNLGDGRMVETRQAL